MRKKILALVSLCSLVGVVAATTITSPSSGALIDCDLTVTGTASINTIVNISLVTRSGGLICGPFQTQTNAHGDFSQAIQLCDASIGQKVVLSVTDGTSTHQIQVQMNQTCPPCEGDEIEAITHTGEPPLAIK